jgi:hypothetical protein
MYNELRTMLVTTVYDSWKTTGYVWEQYNPDTGKGQRTQHFTGWTALIVKIMAMPSLDEKTQLEDVPQEPNAEAKASFSQSDRVMWIVMLAGVVLVLRFRRRLMRAWSGLLARGRQRVGKRGRYYDLG